MRDRVADKVQRFELTRYLGRGASADVWEAVDLANGELVALKLLRADASGRRLSELGFLREVRLLAALDHPRIVRLHDAGVSRDGRYFLATDLVPESLATRWRLDGWPDHRRVLLGVLEGLAVAHARGIAHLDIKPCNILLDHDGLPRIADFGLARVFRAPPDTYLCSGCWRGHRGVS